jgi:hypothetical protein
VQAGNLQQIEFTWRKRSDANRDKGGGVVGKGRTKKGKRRQTGKQREGNSRER